MCVYVCCRTARCTDSFVRFTGLAGTMASQIPPEPSISSVDDCKLRCLRDDNCVGFNWIRVRDGRDASQRCLLYDRVVGDTTTSMLFDLYVRETCETDMIITFVTGGHFKKPFGHTRCEPLVNPDYMEVLRHVRGCSLFLESRKDKLRSPAIAEKADRTAFM